MPSQLTPVLRLFIVLLIPILIVLTAVRLLTTDSYLAFEYSKASFPPDLFGFTRRQRFDLASSNIHYVSAHLPDSTLANQTLNGVPVYSSREVSHMADVRAVFQSVFRTWQAAFVLILLMSLILWQKGERTVLASAIQWGGFLTAMFVSAIALLALFVWQVWFDNFHLVFFEPGSWLFAYSDALIRLFPLQFWMDTTFTISVLALTGGLLTTLIGWRVRLALVKVPILDNS